MTNMNPEKADVERPFTGTIEAAVVGWIDATKMAMVTNYRHS